MSVSIISFRGGQLSSYCFGNIYNDDQVLTTLEMGYNPAADCPFSMVEFAQQKLKPTVFGIANAYAQSLEGILGMGLSLEKYIEGEHLNLSKGITYVTYSTKDEFGIAHKLLEKYNVGAIIIKEQNLMALSCEYTDDIICRIVYDDKYVDAHYCPYNYELLRSGFCSDLEANAPRYRVEKTYRIRNNEIVFFLLACATYLYCGKKRYTGFDYMPSRQPMLGIKDCIRGSLMAGAAGDALGYPVEFMSRNAILSRYGDKGITQFHLNHAGKALISDDTQMTLFTANGILMGITRGCMRGIGGAPENYVDGAYIDWYYTQTGIKESGFGDDFHYTWLRDLPELAHRRSPGNTCLKACESLLKKTKPQNNSKGCGGIMRVAPMGLFDAVHHCYDTPRLALAGAKIAKVTHLHPLGYLPAALLTILISRIVPLMPEQVVTSIYDIIDECLSVMMEMRECDSYADKTYLKDLTLKAVQLSKSVVTDAEAISQLGEGWTAEEAWAISLYCVLRHINSVKDAIIAAVNHNGDSDSTGSVTGNIMGAIYGYDIIKKTRMFCPEGKCFEETLELHDIILALADDLYSGCIISEYSSIDTPEKKQWYGRYCKMKPLM